LVIPQRALADTSVFIGLEAARFDVSRFENFEWGVSAITLGELRLGVLQCPACTFPSSRHPYTAHRQISVTMITADAAHTGRHDEQQRAGIGRTGRSHLADMGRVVANRLPSGTRTATTTRSNTRGPGSSSTRMTDPAMTPGTVPATGA
jgi:predicted nucleic acid-binding protein